MAALQDMVVKVGIQTQAFEWKVTAAMETQSLAEWLNVFSQEGWDVFEILTNPVGNHNIVLRREIPEEES